MHEKTPQDAVDFYRGNRMPADVWAKKYALRDNDDNLLETSPQHSRERWIASVRADDVMAEALREGRLVPAGRIQYGLGNHFLSSTLKNCYVQGILEDSIEGIFATASRMARTYSYGGGTGTPLNALRPRGAKVKNSAQRSSGAASFMDLYSTTTGTISQHGRRGALMLQMSSEHPDVQEFIEKKSDVDPAWLKVARDHHQEFATWLDFRRTARFANVSVQLSDRFLESVDLGTDHELSWQGKYKSTVDARAMWDSMIKGAWQSAEPGLVFWDAMVRESPSDYYGDDYKIICTNPCGEQPLANNDSCNLAALHLARMVHGSFTETPSVHWGMLEQATRAGVRFLDEINTIEDVEGRSPLPEMKEMNLDIRRIGLGVMGLGEMILRMGMVYDSEVSLDFVEHLFSNIMYWAYDESIELSKEKGPFRIYDWNIHKDIPFIQRLPAALQQKMKKYGLRNVTVLTVAPTGTTAVTECTTGGIEPFFDFSYHRNVHMDDNSNPTQYKYYEPIVKEYCGVIGIDVEDFEDHRPNYFVSAMDLDWQMRVLLQSRIQKYVDSSISSTVNLPNSATMEDVSQVYFKAWKSGCKGITVYRQGSREEVLQSLEKEDRAPKRVPLDEDPPELAYGPRLSFKVDDAHRILLDLHFCPSTLKPIEIELRYGKTSPDLDTIAQSLGIVISLMLQNGIPPERIARSLRGIKAGWSRFVKLHPEDDKPTKITSAPDAIAAMLQRYSAISVGDDFVEITNAELCPHCKMRALVYESGCTTCKSCGRANCG